MDVLKSMLAQNPRDIFARYGLAMEHANQGILEQAVVEYRVLLEHNPDYAAAYFHCGQALVQCLAARTACLMSQALAQLGVSGWAIEKAAQ